MELWGAFFGRGPISPQANPFFFRPLMRAIYIYNSIYNWIRDPPWSPCTIKHIWTDHASSALRDRLKEFKPLRKALDLLLTAATGRVDGVCDVSKADFKFRSPDSWEHILYHSATQYIYMIHSGKYNYNTLYTQAAVLKPVIQHYCIQSSFLEQNARPRTV